MQDKGKAFHPYQGLITHRVSWVDPASANAHPASPITHHKGKGEEV
jgi:hypothetical protein